MCSAHVAVEIGKKPNESTICSGVAAGGGRGGRGRSPRSKVQRPMPWQLQCHSHRTESESQDHTREQRPEGGRIPFRDSPLDFGLCPLRPPPATFAPPPATFSFPRTTDY